MRYGRRCYYYLRYLYQWLSLLFLVYVRGYLMRIILILLLLSGCQSALIGSWTRTASPFTSTFKLRADGNGFFCSTMRGKRKKEALTYDSSTIYIKEKEFNILLITDDFLVIGGTDSTNEDFIFYRDGYFKKIGRSCFK